ncbi:MAG: MarR family transcriptional regulator [Curvibacter sp. GWA2_64_110]|nr:MAG: MarR family transcriptional regulator [Curvibacter sp. GWA2_64_110]HCY16999.1 MarR family transcriptional regulator [Curvibacter sp.]
MFDHCLYFNTTALARQLERQWTVAFKPFDLTPPQAFMLRAVLDKPGLLQREIASALVISRPTATRALDGLAAKQLIERRASERDGRELHIYPTSAAQEIHAALNEASGRVTRRLKKLLGEDAFVDTVSKVRGVRSALK